MVDNMLDDIMESIECKKCNICDDSDSICG